MGESEKAARGERNARVLARAYADEKKRKAEKRKAEKREADKQSARGKENRYTQRREPFVSLYANDASVQVTPWDFRVIFGQIDKLDRSFLPPPLECVDTIRITELSEIRMSPQFAKSLAMILFGQIRLYEQTVGPIPLPAELP